ncbi:MAG: hypothetical protein RLO51_21815 [Thalassobaculum sp.]|uniref:hypothetical protein n=1 Tax=Thalassobaculum sp. TaxID=2022740 RepID=UPI0032EF4672
MPGQHQGAIEAARRAERIIANQGGPQGDLAAARAAFGVLTSIIIEHPDDPELTKVAVCGAMRLAAAGRSGNDIATVRCAHLFLGTMAADRPGDPLPRRAYAEASVDLISAEARINGLNGALDVYRGISTLGEIYTEDSELAGIRAKAAANLVAIALEAGQPREARRALADLARLEAQQPAAPMIRQQHARGVFNRLAHAARRDPPGEARAALDALIDAVHRTPGHREIAEFAAEGAFTLVTGLGSRGHLAAARDAYEALAALSRLPESGEGAVGRLADAGFNLITDLCQSGDLAAAQLIYDELAGLSVAHDEDPAIRLAQAKGAANLALSHRHVGDDAAAGVIADDLRALLIGHPDHEELFQIAAFLDAAD